MKKMINRTRPRTRPSIVLKLFLQNTKINNKKARLG